MIARVCTKYVVCATVNFLCAQQISLTTKCGIIWKRCLIRSYLLRSKLNYVLAHMCNFAEEHVVHMQIEWAFVELWPNGKVCDATVRCLSILAVHRALLLVAICNMDNVESSLHFSMCHTCFSITLLSLSIIYSQTHTICDTNNL